MWDEGLVTLWACLTEAAWRGVGKGCCDREGLVRGMAGVMEGMVCSGVKGRGPGLHGVNTMC